MQLHCFADGGRHALEVGVLEAAADVEVLHVVADAGGLVDDGFGSLEGFDEGLVVCCSGACICSVRHHFHFYYI